MIASKNLRNGRHFSSIHISFSSIISLQTTTISAQRMTIKNSFPFVLLLSFAAVCRGFLPSSTQSFLKSGSSFLSTRHSARTSNEDYENALLNNLKRTCIKQFLSQRSLQSFCYLLADLRDPHTSDWIERFLEAPNLLDFHGTGAFNMTKFENWDTYFVELMKNPKERLIIQARKSQTSGRRLFNSGSKNNPYLQQQEHHIEIPIDIDPASFVPRVLSVREQIAREFVIDLDLIRMANDQSKFCSLVVSSSHIFKV